MKHPGEENIQASVDTFVADHRDHVGEDDQAVSDAKNLFASLNGAIKSYTIYPKNHTISKNYFSRLEGALQNFLSRFGVLRFIVDKGKLFYKDVEIHEDEEQESNIAYLFSRDGVKWVEFHDGIKKEEIESFIELINEYRVITPVSDGDIVTAFWQNDFPHIKYEAVDLVLKNGPPLDLSNYQAVNVEQLESGAEKKVDDDRKIDQELDPVANISMVDGKSFPLMEAGKDLWGLTEEEQQYLRRLVDEEENKDHTNSVSEILMLSLMMQHDEQDFLKALDFLQDRLISTFRMGQFRISYTILYNINKLKVVLASKRKWTTPLVEDLVASVSQSKCFTTLPRFLSEEWEDSIDNHLKYLWPSLGLLTPDILVVLCPLVTKIDQEKYRKQFLKLIISHAERDVPFFTRIVLNFDEKLILKFIPIIGMMKKADFISLLLELTKHESSLVRNKSSRKLLLREPQTVSKLFSLLDDPEELIRKRILMVMGQKRDSRTERYLLKYFRGSSRKQHDPRHLIGCYEALGKCGSAESIPFLKKVLFDIRLKNIVHQHTRIDKKGAAIALQRLELSEAKRLLEKGRNSLFPSIRLSCKYAMNYRYGSSRQE